MEDGGFMCNYKFCFKIELSINYSEVICFQSVEKGGGDFDCEDQERKGYREVVFRQLEDCREGYFDRGKST